MASRYVNAADALPADLLDAVYEAVGEKPCYMWVPANRSNNRRERDQYVIQLYEEGYAAADIAVRLFISERTVWRILARERARRASSDGGANPAPSNPDFHTRS